MTFAWCRQQLTDEKVNLNPSAAQEKLAQLIERGRMCVTGLRETFSMSRPYL
jgi:hypothetical protein